MTSNTYHRPRRQSVRMPLAFILSSLIQKSISDGTYHAQTLGHGLVVSVLVQESAFTLEWQTLINYLPDAYRPVEKISPVDYQEGPRAALRSAWQISDRLL